MVPTMSQSWFYAKNEETLGPISLDDLQAAASAGLVKPDTPVREGASGPWLFACQVGGLFAAPPVAAAANPPLAAPPASPTLPLLPDPPAPPLRGPSPPVAGMQPPKPPPREKANPIGVVITVLSSVAACLSLAIIAWVVWRFPHRPRPTTVVATAAASAGSADATSARRCRVQSGRGDHRTGQGRADSSRRSPPLAGRERAA